MMIEDDSEIVILEWKYNPPDFFEEPYIIEKKNYNIEINNGTIKVTISPIYYDSTKDSWKAIYDEVNNLFLGAQTLNFIPFNLSKPSMNRLHPNGRKDVTVFSDPLLCKVSLRGSVDFIQKDKDGKIIIDTKAKRIALRKHFAQLASKYNNLNNIVSTILRSYNNAVNDSANEFIHLYEIFETLRKKFVNEKQLCDALGVSRNKIDRLRKLANKEPLTQGRHRGKNPGQLRNATNTEKNEARNIAKTLIHNYLKYLDENG